PLILLAIPSVYAGWYYVEPMLFGDWFGSSIVVSPAHPAMAAIKEEWHGVGAFILHGFASLPLWLAIAGIAAAFYCYIIDPALPARLRKLAGPLYTLLDNKYYFDRFNDWFFAGGTRELGEIASNVGDRRIIDGFFVNGSARAVGLAASILRKLQSGYVYQYAFTMIIGVFALLTWWVVR
ncbi:MAG TPA: NADH-quinone oxidoreductase subunit L, partial [Casimicrobiaceae bacterium]